MFERKAHLRMFKQIQRGMLIALCLFLAIVAAACVEKDGEASTAAGESRSAAFAGVEKPQIRWHFGSYRDHAVTAYSADSRSGMIYVSSVRNIAKRKETVLSAILPNGEVKWEKRLGESAVSSCPEPGQEGNVYATSKGNLLIAFASDGSRRWAFHTREGIASCPVVGADGTIYVRTTRDRMIAVDRDGNRRWSYPTWTASRHASSKEKSVPLIGRDTVYVSFQDGTLSAVTPQGEKRWSLRISRRALTAPVFAADGSIIVGSRDGNLHAVSSDGKRLWSFAGKGEIESAPAVDRDGTIYAGTADGYIYAVDKNGHKKWLNRIKDRTIVSSPLIDRDGVVYVGGSVTGAEHGKLPKQPARLYAYRPEGSVKWSYDIWNHGQVLTPVLLKDRQLLVATRAGGEESPKGMLYSVEERLSTSPFALDAESIKLFADGKMKGIPFMPGQSFPVKEVLNTWGRADRVVDHEDIHIYVYEKQEETIQFTVDELQKVYYYSVGLHIDRMDLFSLMGAPSRGNWMTRNLFWYDMDGGHVLQVEAGPKTVRLIMDLGR